MDVATQYLYIAREYGRPDLLKVGQTTRAPAVRRVGLRGQADTDFEMLRVYPTTNALYAETLAKAMLDARGARRGRNTRRELFAIDLAQAEAVCARAARQANKLANVPTRPEPALRSRHRLSAPSAFWAEMLRLPLRYCGKMTTLGALMALALESAPAARRLARFGIVCSAFRAAKPEFRIDWGNQALQAWHAQRGLKTPAASGGAEQVSFRRTAR
jgi:hypothetical protein